MTPEEVMQEVRRIEITTRHLVRDLVAGEYSSAFRGRGVEFAEVREYAPGDDIRTIDWNVTARLGSAYVKRFHEERELTVLFLVDLSGSTAFGSRRRTKAELAVEVAAVLALAAARGNDRIGLLTFSDRVDRFLEPARGRRQAFRLIGELLTERPRGSGTTLTDTLEYLEPLLRRRAVLFILSDFLTSGYETVLARLARRHDAIAVHLRDPRERELPAVGLLPIADPETGEWRMVDTDDPVLRRRLVERSLAHDATLERTFRHRGVDLLRLDTDRSYAEALLAFFRRRQRQVGRVA
jgi:uncharacterized protein (DUF58 family)